MFIFHLYNAQARVKQMIEVVRDAEFVVCKTLEENNHACSTVSVIRREFTCIISFLYQQTAFTYL